MVRYLSPYPSSTPSAELQSRQNKQLLVVKRTLVGQGLSSAIARDDDNGPDRQHSFIVIVGIVSFCPSTMEEIKRGEILGQGLDDKTQT